MSDEPEADSAGHRSDLERFFWDADHRRIHKWSHYFEIYERHLQRFRGLPVTLLEIGVSHGGSLQMWRDYLGPEARIHGIDIDPRCKVVEEEGIEVHIGDQADRDFLRRLVSRLPEIDIVLDDGGQTRRGQVRSFEVLYPALSATGLYICEDTHSSYWSEFGGGYRRRGTFTEAAKRLIDRLNAWRLEPPSWVEVPRPDGGIGRRGRKLLDEGRALLRPAPAADWFTRSTGSIHFYDSVVVVERRNRSEPVEVVSGSDSF